VTLSGGEWGWDEQSWSAGQLYTAGQLAGNSLNLIEATETVSLSSHCQK